MKSIKPIVLAGFLALLLGSSACAKENVADSFVASGPSSTPVPFMKIAAEPTPAPETALRQRLLPTLNHMIRREVDFEDASPLEGAQKQSANVKVYMPEQGPHYYVFLALKDRTVYVEIQTDLPNGFVYRRASLFEKKLPGAVYEYSFSGTVLTHQAKLVDEFTYWFDPDCVFEYQNKYFYMWSKVRDKVIEEAKTNIWASGEYTLVFCDYDERYALYPERAYVAVIIIGNGTEEYFDCRIQPEGAPYFKYIDQTEKSENYYKVREFDRETVYVETKEIVLPEISRTLEKEQQQRITLAFDHIVRNELDLVEHSPLDGVRKQTALVKVYKTESRDVYDAFMVLKDRILYIQIVDYGADCRYREVRLYNGKLPGDIYEYVGLGNTSYQQARLIGQFKYELDPKRVVEDKKEYKEMWPTLRAKVIEDVTANTWLPGEYTLLFCEAGADVVVIRIGNGRERYYQYGTYGSGKLRVGKLAGTEKQENYYKAREFDRQTVHVG